MTSNSSQLHTLLVNAQTRLTCPHPSWFLMKTDLGSAGSTCDYKVVQGGNNSVEVKLANAGEKHYLAQVTPNGDTYYVCQSCHAIRCSNCHTSASN